MNHKERPPVYYSEYLQLDKILNAQLPESEKEGKQADDEMLFIIIHQTYELWFKQILHELTIIRRIFKKEKIANSSADMYEAVHHLNRVCRILDIAVSQMTVLETMTPLDFLDFRDLLRPASGFQSIQFKIIEATLGLQYDDRHGKGYYLSQLNQSDIDSVKQAENEESLLVLIERWLERMPFTKDSSYWQENNEYTSFWDKYYEVYKGGLLEAELPNLKTFETLFLDADNYPETRRLSIEANRSALFIMLYRDHPLLHLPYELLSKLLEIDELLAMWRYRHIHMVQRTIGKRVGTGGSTGAAYLRTAADTHYVFKELAELSSFLLPRTAIPNLPENLIRDLSFS